MGGLFSLLITGTPFSISAAVGLASVIGVCTLGGVVMLSGIGVREEKSTAQLGEGIEAGALAEMRPVLMACAAAGLGLLPGAVSTRDRRAGAAAAGARGGGRHGDFAAGDSVFVAAVCELGDAPGRGCKRNDRRERRVKLSSVTFS